MNIFRKEIPFGVYAILCYLSTVIISWSYGNSYAVYVASSVVIAIFSYYLFFSGRNRNSSFVKGVVTYLLVVTLFLGVVNGDLKSSIMVNISMLLPFSLSALNVSYDSLGRQAFVASVVNLVIIVLLGSNLDAWNSNTLAFVIFCGITVGMIWFKISRGMVSLIASSVYLVFATSLLLAAGSRNAGIGILICYLMLLMPLGLYKNIGIYRFTYIFALLATVFAHDFMVYVLSDDKIMGYLLSYTSSFSDKAWGMDTHYILLQAVSRRFSEMDIFTQLFGMGVKFGHTHNLFYQCLFFYGYIGTFLLYMLYVYVFERAYRLIKNNNDIIALCCYVILLGHFLLQIGEVYMLGSETANLMSAFPVAVILHRWNNFNSKKIRARI